MNINKEKLNSFIERQLNTQDSFESFFSILKQSLNFFQKNFSIIFPFFFLLLVIPNIISLLIQRVVLISTYNVSSPLYFTIIILLVTLFSLFVSIFSLVTNFGSCHLISSLDEGKHESLSKSLKFILKRKKTILVSIFLSPLLLIGAFTAFLLPLVFFIFGMIFLPHSVMIEGKSFKNAFVQSFWYSKDKKWYIFLKVILLFLFCIFFANVFSSLFTLIYKIIPDIVHNSIFFVSLSTVIEYSISSIFWSFVVTFVYFLWKSIKNVTSGEPDEHFKNKYIKVLKIFGILGLIAIILLITISIIFAPTRM